MKKEFTIMQEYLMKVLSTMKMKSENKVLIAFKLTTDKQIYLFLKWLKENMPEEMIPKNEKIILRQVSKISKGDL